MKIGQRWPENEMRECKVIFSRTPKDVVWRPATQTAGKQEATSDNKAYYQMSARAFWGTCEVKRSMIPKKMTVTTRSFTSYIHCTRQTSALFLFPHMQSRGVPFYFYTLQFVNNKELTPMTPLLKSIQL